MMNKGQKKGLICRLSVTQSQILISVEQLFGGG
jgi:hypothetical protein